jgi:hypothetical protein
MEILTGIFVLFCAGVVAGYSFLFVRSHEVPKKELTVQVMQQNQDPSRTAATSPEGAKEGKENLTVEQKPEDQQQSKK